jgi:hypothetical protein
METIGSRIFDILGADSPLLTLEVTVEESMEMLGIALFIRVLAELIQSRIGTISFQFGASAIESQNDLMQDVEFADRRTRERRAS